MYDIVIRDRNFDIFPSEDAYNHIGTIDTISIVNCQIIEVPEWIYKFVNVANLYLYDNRIAKIPDRIMEFKNLRYLNISHNCITEVPDIFFNISSLHIEGNNIDYAQERLLTGKVGNIVYFGPLWVICDDTVGYIPVNYVVFYYPNSFYNNNAQLIKRGIFKRSVGTKRFHNILLTMLILALRDEDGRPKFAEGLVWILPREILIEVFKCLTPE